LEKIWLFVNQLLNPFLASLYRWNLSNEEKFTIEEFTPSPLVLSLP